MSQVCSVTVKVWQRGDGRWGGQALLRGPSKRRTKVSHTGCVTREEAEQRVNGDVNELINVMGWERRDEQVKGQ